MKQDNVQPIIAASRVGQLPLTSVNKFNGSIDDFILTQADAEGKVQVVVINPGQSVVKDVTDSATGRVYLRAAFKLPFSYKHLIPGRHEYIDVESNVGFSAKVAVIKRGNSWVEANANGQTLMPAADINVGTWGPNRVQSHEALDTILTHTVVIHCAQCVDGRGNNLVALATALKAILDAKDVPTALAMRDAAFAAKAEARQAYRTAANFASVQGYQAPAELYVIIDGQYQDAIPVLKAAGNRHVQALDAEGNELRLMKRPIDGSGVLFQWMEQQANVGHMFKIVD